MKLAICNPYGTQPSEIGPLIAALRMAQEYGHSVSAIGCDGCITHCDRSVNPTEGLKRRIHECFGCRKDQSRIFDALGVSARPLSSYLDGSILSETFSEVMSCRAKDLSALSYRGEALSWLARSSLKSRFGSVDAAFDNAEIVADLRGLLLSVARIVAGGINFLEQESPDRILIVGKDMIAESISFAAQCANIPSARFVQNVTTDELQIFDSIKNEVFSHKIEGLASFRVATPVPEWNTDLFDSVREVLQFLNVPVVQMNLFAANQA
jgi:hypothetical protein